MTNRTVPAAAEGMPSLTRRLFLRGAAVVAPMLAVPAIASTTSSYIEENATLLALEPDLHAVVAEVVAAKAAYAEALRVGSALWPRAPEPITRKWSPGLDLERNIVGYGYEPHVGLDTSLSLHSHLGYLMRSRRRTQDLQEARTRCRELIAIADAYEAECHAAKVASGYDAANKRLETARETLLAVVSRIQAEPCKTMAGVRLKAKALDVWGKHAHHTALIVQVDGRQNWLPDLARVLLETLEG